MSASSAFPLGAPNLTHLWTRMLVEELVRLDINRFFVAPGARSTPLTVAAVRHPATDVVLHVDERGNAFAALGHARTQGGAAAWITTSGTAVANGLPAVVEASVDGVPMVLLTADRPPELRDTGANQTIDQVKLFGDFVRQHVDVPPPSEAIDPAYVLTTVDQAVHRARRVPAGPVHLNCSFRKPLEPTDDPPSGPIPDAVTNWARTDGPFTRYPTPDVGPDAAQIDDLLGRVGPLDRGLLVAGRLDTAAEAEAVRRLGRRLGWPLVPDLTSRLRLGPAPEDGQVPFADLILTSDRARRHLRPDAVLHVGGRAVSKRLRLFLRETAPTVRAVVRPTPARLDPDHRVTHHIEAHLQPFVDAMLGRLEDRDGSSPWRRAWAAANERVRTVIDEHLTDGALTEPAVAAVLSRERPPDHALLAGNSMPVRDLNRHAAPGGGSGPAYANRGASGIDGTVATAAGLAAGHQGPVTTVLGDLALWHDLNSLALLPDRPVVVVVVNNDGGGIFHFLPIRDHDEVFEPHFTTPHHRTFEDAARTFGLTYSQPTSVESLRAAYREACDHSGPSLIEVQTDRGHNREVHEAIEQRASASVDQIEDWPEPGST
ncbi:MAG: 2-succinyl-5-enolpyruvyl-6-hydroxy-3-cyclohexene-1-carboxylic-acid synthase [Salinibacter sp.]